MTEAELAAIEARANAAQRGPWRPDIDGPGMVYAGALNLDDPMSFLIALCWQDTGGNADFIAHARTDIPALIAEVRRLRAALERVRDGTVQPCPFCPAGGLYCVCVGVEAEDQHGTTPAAVSHDPEQPCGIAQAALAGTAQE